MTRSIVIAAVMAALLSGCASTINPRLGAAADALRTKAGEAYDETLDTAERFICDDASVRSVRDRYWKSAERAKTWEELCGSKAPIPTEDAE